MYIVLLKCQIAFLKFTSFSRVYSNCCYNCSFEPEIIKIGQSSFKMHSNNILIFQESMTILNACIKFLKPIECTTYFPTASKNNTFIRGNSSFIYCALSSSLSLSLPLTLSLSLSLSLSLALSLSLSLNTYILYWAVYISDSANTLGKGTHSTFISPALNSRADSVP